MQCRKNPDKLAQDRRYKHSTFKKIAVKLWGLCDVNVWCHPRWQSHFNSGTHSAVEERSVCSKSNGTGISESYNSERLRSGTLQTIVVFARVIFLVCMSRMQCCLHLFLCTVNCEDTLFPTLVVNMGEQHFTSAFADSWQPIHMLSLMPVMSMFFFYTYRPVS